MTTSLNNNLTELDSLLQDLSTSRFSAERKGINYFFINYLLLFYLDLVTLAQTASYIIVNNF